MGGKMNKPDSILEYVRTTVVEGDQYGCYDRTVENPFVRSTIIKRLKDEWLAYVGSDVILVQLVKEIFGEETK